MFRLASCLFWYELEFTGAVLRAVVMSLDHINSTSRWLGLKPAKTPGARLVHQPEDRCVRPEMITYDGPQRARATNCLNACQAGR